MDATPLIRLGDRILERLAPKATAEAAEGHYQYRCVYLTTSCAKRNSQQRRWYDADTGWFSGWVTIGCC